MAAPVEEIGGLGDPNEMAAGADSAGPMHGPIVGAEATGKEGAILIMRREDEAVALEGLPIARGDKAHADTELGDGGVSEPVAVVEELYANVFDAEGLKRAIAKEEWFFVEREGNAVVAPGEAEMGEGGEIVAALVGEATGIGTDEIGIVGAQAQDADAGVAGGIQNWGAEPAGLLEGALGDTHEQPNAAFKAEGPGIEDGLDGEIWSGRDDAGGGEERIVWEALEHGLRSLLEPEGGVMVE